MQAELRAKLATGGLFQQPSAAGDASEHCWLELFNRHLSRRYRAAPVFVVDSRGRRSRQVDLAIFDNLYSPVLFPHCSGLHVRAESVYAIFEIKTFLTPHYIKYAGEIAASVRGLKRTSVPAIANGRKRAALEPRPILAGILRATSMWTPATFEQHVRESMALLKPPEKLDLGCALDHGAFERGPSGKLVYQRRRNRCTSSCTGCWTVCNGRARLRRSIWARISGSDAARLRRGFRRSTAALRR